MRHRRSRRASEVEQAQAAHALLTAVLESGEAATDDAHRRYELPQTVDQRAWGAVTMRLLAEGVISRTGDQHTRRAVAHGRRIGRYIAPDRDRAAAYRDRLAAQAAQHRPRQRTLWPDGREG